MIFILHPRLDQDDHNNPALLALPDKRILAMYSKHGQERKIYYRFSEPGNPLAWSAAQEFVRPLTFAALSGEKVITDLFGVEAQEPNIESAVEHIAVAQSIDALVVAPATADTIAKFAHGLADDFLSTLFLASTAPTVVAPAMNVNMWNNAATQEIIRVLKARGILVVEPDSGYLACGMVGAGRLAANQTIVEAVMDVLGTLVEVGKLGHRAAVSEQASDAGEPPEPAAV